MKKWQLTPDLARIQFDSSREWLEAREGIGGSDASAILGLNPYKTNQELWMEKKGQMSPVDISNKPYVKYGNDAESLLRALFSLDYPEYTVELVCLIHQQTKKILCHSARESQGQLRFLL